MKRFLNILIVLSAVFSSLPAFCEVSEYYSVPVYDAKNNFEIARAIVPDNFETSSSLIWTRDFENPASFSFSAKSKKEDVAFYYRSKTTYVDILNGEELQNGGFDKDFRTINKKIISPDEYVKNVIISENENAVNITKLSEAIMPQGMDEYLIGLMYKKIEELNITAKADSGYSKISITNPKILPYITTFSFEKDGKSYYQTFLTVFTSIEYQFVSKKKSDKNKMKDKVFWEMKGLYSYCAEQNIYDKHFEDFVLFAANSMPNNKATNAIDSVKREMVIELNPSSFDTNKRTVLQTKPSELFRRYFEEGLPDYSYADTMIKPTLTHVRWLVNILDPQNEFSYKKVKQLWKQNFYTPQKYKYVYFNQKDGKWLISTEQQKLDRTWIKLKQTTLKNKKSN